MSRCFDRMTSLYRILLFVAPAMALTTLPAAASAEEPPPTLFQEYIDRPDDAFQWKIVDKIVGDDVTTLVIDLTSQKWRSPDEVDRTEWKHWLIVVRPRRVEHDAALLIVGGGASSGQPPAAPDARLLELALKSRSVVAELKSVPNQPLTFNGHDQPLVEDALLAYCMNRSLETGDLTWLPRLPMVKSVVRAMDAVQAALGDESLSDADRVDVRRFVVAGGSKRGWTTWLVPTVDRRVVAIMPLVIDVLNVRRSMAHHLAAYGQWSPALADYQQGKLLDKQAMDRSAALMAIDDPYTYRNELDLPKYIVNASGDEFFVSDSSQFYWDDLVGEKHLRYVPNANHSLNGTDAVQGMLAFYQFILADQPRPKYDWQIDKDGSIELSADIQPLAVRQWQATNPESRDFRLQTLGPKFVSRRLHPDDEGRYQATIAPPDKGWTAHFVEAEFAGPDGVPLKITSGVSVSPTTLPYAEKAQPYLEPATP